MERTGLQQFFGPLWPLYEQARFLREFPDAQAAAWVKQKSYASVAQECAGVYITVLLGTLTSTQAVAEEKAVAGLLSTWRNSDTLRGVLDHHILVAVAPLGWAKFDVFLHQPGREAIRFEIPRQRLMLKLVDGQPQAWHFYPRPEKVWVHRLLKTGSDLQLARAAFEVAPAKDSVASLADAVREKLGIMSLESVEIH